MAIEHALTVLHWHENLSSEDVPPEYLWEDVEGLERWWKSVEDRQKDGQPTKRSGGSSEDDDDDDQTPGMAENDLARFLKQG